MEGLKEHLEFCFDIMTSENNLYLHVCEIIATKIVPKNVTFNGF